ncbi:hypothetical protein MAR_033867 [Mya arenaria]|uniref:C1q domain-containing protein n=1 Tax=Mya arenaria TaxID=6604 RepID=A0ABY7GA81_MYAAR|nr:hypothetical protein MAR_033867 [Mya arenaria]
MFLSVYSSKRIRKLCVVVLVIESSMCNMNEPRCYSRFDYEEKMLEKMVRTEIKIEELLGKLDALEKMLTNAETEVDTLVKDNHVLEKRPSNVEAKLDNSIKEIHGLEKKHDIELDKSRVCTTHPLPSSPSFRPVLQHPPFFKRTIVFNNVVTDVGGGYNLGTGVFTAPINGLYVFSTSVMVDLSTSSTLAHIRISKNGNHIEYLYIIDSNSEYETGAGTVILSLQVGDTVKVACFYDGRSIKKYSYISVSHAILRNIPSFLHKGLFQFTQIESGCRLPPLSHVRIHTCSKTLRSGDLELKRSRWTFCCLSNAFVEALYGPMPCPAAKPCPIHLLVCAELQQS